jgi:delta(3,5)-delta(2,4)-dienoyl-CoA isomerase
MYCFLRSGTKQSILFSREHTVKESMQHVKMWNSAYLQGEDLQEAMRAVLSKEQPTFTKN